MSIITLAPTFRHAALTSHCRGCRSNPELVGVGNVADRVAHLLVLRCAFHFDLLLLNGDERNVRLSRGTKGRTVALQLLLHLMLVELLLHFLMHLLPGECYLLRHEVLGLNLELRLNLGTHLIALLFLQQCSFVARLAQHKLLLQLFLRFNLPFDSLLRCLNLQLNLFFFGHAPNLAVAALAEAKQVLRNSAVHCRSHIVADDASRKSFFRWHITRVENFVLAA